MSKLGFIFLCSEPENEDKDLLESSDSGGSGSSEEAVCLLRAVRLPGRHAKLVRATAPNGYSLACFDPSEELYKQGLLLPEAVVSVIPSSDESSVKTSAYSTNKSFN